MCIKPLFPSTFNKNLNIYTYFYNSNLYDCVFIQSVLGEQLTERFKHKNNSKNTKNNSNKIINDK